MKNDILLELARSCYDKVKAIEYPKNFSTGSWWKNIQSKTAEAIRSFKSCEEAILWAQRGLNTAFDHRWHGARSIIDFKIKELERCFPGFYLEGYNNLCESIYSDKASIEEFNGRKYSNIFLTHLNYYLRSTWTFGLRTELNRVIEIGGGYGALARIFKLMNPNVVYTIIDLADSLFFAHVFLSLNFPNARIKYVTENSKINIDEYDFVLIPVQLYESVSNEKFDVVINTCSLQEISSITVGFWMDFIQNFIQVKVFYSFNYFLVNKRLYSETSKDEANLICPILDPFWKIRYFRINPDVITCDASGRNWLELCVERIPLEDRNLEKIKEYGDNLFRICKLHPKGSNDRFQNLYMAIWYNPQKEFLSEMIDCIEAFKKGLGAVNNIGTRVYNPGEFKDIFRFNKQVIKSFLKRIKNYFWKDKYNFTDFSECYYYKDLLKSSIHE